MKLPSAYRDNLRFWLKGYLFVGVAALIVAVLLYSNRVINRLQDQADATNRTFSLFFENVSFDVETDGSLRLLGDVIRANDYPIIITVVGRPIMWHNVGLEPRTDEDFELIMNMDLQNPPTEKLRSLIRLVQEYDGHNRPIPISINEETPPGQEAVPQAYLHIGKSRLQTELQFMPWVQLALFLLFMAVALQGLRLLKVSEQRSLWVGLAKETAHQLGTPMSSLLGWVELIKEQDEKGDHGAIRTSVQEMEVDLARLNKVTQRFSKIGATPDLRPVDLLPIVRNTVEYFHKRLPRLKANSSIELHADSDLPMVKGNAELLEWVFENLVKNGLDALGDQGKITLTVSRDSDANYVNVFVKDTGRGIPPRMRDRVFEAGYTTKQRGWGLGLALTRRIVEDHHSGAIRVWDSRPGKGTTFLVRLPAVT